ncbi:hypothetical protein GCM10010994_04400 [Chelatococcus reniformis]|uniref:Uncharacterized protein n=2 Tax=Chelatococcus reniformis TaxID=1494448 RepID=A0A916TWT7_9HYPH|nr:hypothetical protein GCM10010994_04400 [Chelatococcus reniformis]
MIEAARTLAALLPADLAGRIEKHGYAVVDGFVPPDELRKAQAFVRGAVARNGGEYVGFSGHEDLGGTFLERLQADPAFVGLCRGIYQEGNGAPAPDVGFYQILRCLAGTQAKRHSMRFHYDSYVLTALIPIMMPSHGTKGNLIILPQTRPIRKFYGANLVDKILVDNRLSQVLFKYAYGRRWGRMVSLELKPGNLYFFWGYRSLHTNEPCDADEIRSTALFHFVDPHAQSSLKRMMRTPAEPSARA